MKVRGFCRVSLLFIVSYLYFVLGSCPDEFEPNERIENATTIQLGSAYFLSICPGDVRDAFGIPIADVVHPVVKFGISTSSEYSLLSHFLL
jgi:hypothetical protein